MIIISPTNPIRFKGALDYEFDHNEFKCYLQKYNRQDRTFIQVLSDEEEAPTMTVRRSEDGAFVRNFFFAHVAENLIINETFKAYEVEILFSELGIGEFYFEIGDGQTSGTVKVLENHQDTVMIKYRNSYNRFGVLFDTDIVFYLRVEGTIRNYEPKSDDVIYTDQGVNVSKLYSMPYNVFTFFAGSGQGLPDYMLDIVNRSFSCDMIKIDDQWFEKVEGAEWEIVRVDDYPFAGMSINIIPAINNISEQLRIDEGQDLEPSETMIIQRYSNNYQDVTGDLTVNNIFEKNSVLNYIRVYRKAEPYVLKVGTSAGGNDICEVNIQNLLHTINLNHAFNEPQSVYLTGMVGGNDISLVWDKVDKFFNPSASNPDPTPQPSSALAKGAVIEWDGTDVELEEQFNLNTGLGRETGDWVGWCICNGENGTPDMRRRVSVGFDSGAPTSSVYRNLRARFGNEFYSITKDQLPKFRVNLFVNETRRAESSSDLSATNFAIKGTTSSGSKDEKYSILSSGTEPTLGLSSEVGKGHAISMMQPSIIMVKIKKIF